MYPKLIASDLTHMGFYKLPEPDVYGDDEYAHLTIKDLTLFLSYNNDSSINIQIMYGDKETIHTDTESVITYLTSILNKDQ